MASEPLNPLVESIRTLVSELEDLKRQHPDKYFGTPYRSLHMRLAAALESYEREKAEDERQTDEH